MQKTSKCGFMILTPTPLHQGGMWCAEEYPCKNHGAWKQNEPPLTPQTGEIAKDVPKNGEIPQLSAEQLQLVEEWWDKNCLTFGMGDKSMRLGLIIGIIATALEEQRVTERQRAAKIVESWMEDDEHWQPIAQNILNGKE